MVIGIIGAGASGMAAALAAARNPQVQVLLLERQARVGRKLQATGNGRCNLTNQNMDLRFFHGEEAAFAEKALEAFDAQVTLDWFAQLGLYTVAEPSGRVYPYSDQANSVVDVLRFALEKPNIRLVTGCEIQKIRKDEQGFVLTGPEEEYRCHRLIVACGGLAGTKLGGSLSGYKLLAKLGHRSTKLRPSLVQLKTDWPGVSALKGVRANCHAQILWDGKPYAASTGELQFTQYGISGPVTFEISRDVCQMPGKWTCRMDFVPELSREQLFSRLIKRQETELPVEELLTGILHNRLGRVLTKAADVDGRQYVKELSQDQLEAVCACVKAFEITLTEPMGMDSAQVTAGGVYTRDFDPATMESKLVPGLYVCGELLDIDGACGGYNLQWAWSSGHCAGSAAGKEKA